MFRTTSSGVSKAALAAALALPAVAYAQTTYTYNDIDTDGNLELSDVEFQQYSAGLFERYDADADGYLSDDEFTSLETEAGSFGTSEPFEAWDTESDSLLDANEFNAGLYDAYDADDGLGIDEQEFAAYGMDGGAVGGPDNQIEAQVVSLNEWGYDELYSDGTSVETLLDANVLGDTGEDVGDVENVLFGPGGELVSVIVEVGGFLDVGDTHLNVPWDMVESATWDADGIRIPFTEEQFSDPESYGLFNEQLGYGYDDGLGYDNAYGGAELEGTEVAEAGETVVASEQIAEVSGDGIGTVETGPRVWRASDLIGDYARVQDGDAYMNYGYVEDIIVRDGQIAAVLVSPDRGVGATGYRAFPYTGAGYANGWNPGLGYYDLPYGRSEVDAMGTFDDDQLANY